MRLGLGQRYVCHVTGEVNSKPDAIGFLYRHELRCIDEFALERKESFDRALFFLPWRNTVKKSVSNAQ